MDKDEELAREIGRAGQAGRVDYARVERLLHEGADPNASWEGASLLHALGSCRDPSSAQAARALVEFGADVESRGAGGATPLGAAAMAGNPTLCAELVRRGANLGARDEAGCDPMARALERLDEEVAQMLLEAGYPAPGCRDALGRPALVAVAERPRAAGVACEFLHRGADPDGADEDGWTPLATAARAGNPAMAVVLLDAGVDPRAPGPFGLGALAIALGARALASKPGAARVGPAHISCALALARRMGGGWGSAPDAGGWPPLARLYRSIARFEPVWMGELERAGADALAAGHEGWGLLRLAAEVGPEASGIELARWAIARGASPAERCGRGALPEDAALSSGRFELHGLLRSEREGRELARALADAGAEGRGRAGRL